MLGRHNSAFWVYHEKGLILKNCEKKIHKFFLITISNRVEEYFLNIKNYKKFLIKNYQFEEKITKIDMETKPDEL